MLLRHIDFVQPSVSIIGVIKHSYIQWNWCGYSAICNLRGVFFSAHCQSRYKRYK